MHRIPVFSPSYIYSCTRLRIRKSSLINYQQYRRLLNMEIPQIIRFMGENGYSREIHHLHSQFTGINLAETALTWHLGRASYDCMRTTSGLLNELTRMYLNKWDIINVMSIIRGKKHGLPYNSIEEMLIPAGEIGLAQLNLLLMKTSVEQVMDALSHWRYYPFLQDYLNRDSSGKKLSDLENELYKKFYEILIHDLKKGIIGANEFLGYLRYEIDTTNIKNLFRIRSSGVNTDISGYMISGGFIPPEEFSKIAGIEDKDEFITEFKNTRLIDDLLPVLQRALNNPALIGDDAALKVWEQWQKKEYPVQVVLIAAIKIRLKKLSQMATMSPFSVLPIISYLEEKKYEVYNLRAIVRGKEYGIASEKIFKYLVMPSNGYRG